MERINHEYHHNFSTKNENIMETIERIEDRQMAIKNLTLKMKKPRDLFKGMPPARKL